MMAYVTLEDDSGSLELLAFQRALDTGGGYLHDNAALLVRGRISVREERGVQVVVDSFRPLSDLAPLPGQAEKRDRKLYLRLDSGNAPAMRKIELLLELFVGDDPMIIYYSDLKKQRTARCLIHDSLLRELREMLGEANVVVK